MELQNRKKTGFSISQGFRESFYGFKKLWIVFCSLAVIILIIESYLPEVLIGSVSETKYIKPYLTAFKQFKSEVLSLDKASDAFMDFKCDIIRITSTVIGKTDFYILMSKIITAFIIVTLVLCLLYIITILISKYSVWTNKNDVHLKNSIKKSPVISISYFTLSFIKAAPFSISLLIPMLYLIIRTINADTSGNNTLGHFDLNFMYILEFLGVLLISAIGLAASLFIYVRLYFTGFIITEASANPFSAMKRSWTITKKYTFKIFILFVITLAGDIISGLTIICFIPWTGVKYTVRASVYQQILKNL